MMGPVADRAGEDSSGFPFCSPCPLGILDKMIVSPSLRLNA